MTDVQRAALPTPGISYKRPWSWRTGDRLPTEAQTACLAAAAGTDRAELQKEVTVLRADESEREEIARLVNWRRRSFSILKRTLSQAARIMGPARRRWRLSATGRHAPSVSVADR